MVKRHGEKLCRVIDTAEEKDGGRAREGGQAQYYVQPNPWPLPSDAMFLPQSEKLACRTKMADAAEPWQG